MPRALSMLRESVSALQRDAFRGLALRSREHYVAAGCNYWVFEEDGAPGSYLQFVEAPDHETLLAGRRGAPGRPDAAAATYTEVSLV